MILDGSKYHSERDPLQKILNLRIWDYSAHLHIVIPQQQPHTHNKLIYLNMNLVFVWILALSLNFLYSSALPVNYLAAMLCIFHKIILSDKR